MGEVIRHLVEDDDQQHFPGEARCSCGARVRGDRSKRLAWAYRHLADALDPPV